jgi:hypothetical protein
VIPYRERWHREGSLFTRAPHMMGMGMGVGFSSPPPWTPAALGATVLEWLEADYGVTLAGGFVTNVTARGSAAKDLAQGTVVSQPAWVASGSSGILRFDGSNDFLKTAAFAAPLSQPVHHFIACKATQTEAYDSIFDGRDGANRHSLYLATMGSSALCVSAGGVTSVADKYADATWTIYDICFNGATTKVAVNGGEQATVSAGTDSLGGMCVGSRHDGALTIAMDWYAHIICAGDGSATFRSQMIDYLRRKATAAGIVLP